ncbi:MAG: sel1 repeat family protein [Simkania sp.]|nr:sel1 repeat family protein [Simkania sp.]
MFKSSLENYMKKISEKIAAYTKYVHLVLYLLVWLGFSSAMWAFSKGSLPLLGIIVFGGLINLCIGVIFWGFPSIIIKWKKRKGKNWSGLLTALNVFLVRFFIWPIFTLAVFFLIAGWWMRGIDSDRPTATFKDTEISALQGDKIAQYNMGVFYSLGEEGVSQNYDRALKWYLLAADQGVKEAQTNLGIAYREGRGVPRDYEKAFEYFLLAANQRGKIAQASLGYQYYYGYGIEKNFLEAFKWYTLAAEAGEETSIRPLKKLKKILSPQEINSAVELIKTWKKNHEQ